MPVSGEAIRMMNLVDDIATTLRKITANIGFMTEEERKKVAEYMKNSDPSYDSILKRLEKGD